MKIKSCLFFCLLVIFFSSNIFAQDKNLLKPFRDSMTGMQISFPATWKVNPLEKELIVEAVSPPYPKGGGQDTVNIAFVDVDEDLSYVSDSEWKAVGDEIYRKAFPGSIIMNAEVFVVNGVKGYEVLGKKNIEGKKIILGQFYIPQKKRIYIITLATQEPRLDQVRSVFRNIIQTFKI